MQYVEVSRLRMSVSYTRRTGLIVDAPRNDLEAVSLIVNQLIASATVPAEEIFFINTLDDIAATAAGELSRFIEQRLGINEFYPVAGHGGGGVVSAAFSSGSPSRDGRRPSSDDI